MPTVCQMHVTQTMRVKWGNTYSQYFNVSNGVKQGEVISPILFNLYLDELLISLRTSGYGCYVGNTFCGALAYADGITFTNYVLFKDDAKCMFTILYSI